MLGYGEIDGHSITTDISTPESGARYSAYFRTTITTTQYHDYLTVEILADDGGILYVDGEIAAYLNYSGEDEYTGLSLMPGEEGVPKTVVLYGLPAGEHAIAFSLHNRSPLSADLGFDLQIAETDPFPALENLSWTSADGEITITDSNPFKGGVLSIPAMIDGLPVTTISSYAFRDTYWSSVIIPDSVTSIKDHAFYECTRLTSVTIPDSVTSIGRYAFFRCSSLTSMTIPGSVTSIGDYAFRECSSLTSVSILNGVTSIGDYAFYGCSSLTSLTIPDSVTSVG